MTTIVGAARIVFPQHDPWAPDRALLPIQKKLSFDATDLAPAGKTAEVGRVSVRAEWRGTLAFLELCDAMCRECRAQQTEVLVSTVNLDCDDFVEADLIRQVLNQRGHWSGQPVAFALTPVICSGQVRFFKDEERTRALTGEVGGLRLPRAVASDIRLGARYFGPPLWDRTLNRYLLPMWLCVDELACKIAFYRRKLAARIPTANQSGPAPRTP